MNIIDVIEPETGKPDKNFTTYDPYEPKSKKEIQRKLEYYNHKHVPCVQFTITSFPSGTDYIMILSKKTFEKFSKNLYGIRNIKNYENK